VDGSNFDVLSQALEYLEKRISAAEADREARYAMASEYPVGSQNSFVVSYSQDSKLSGEEPPEIQEITAVIVETLPETRLQQLFPFGNEDNTTRRVDIAIPFLDTNLGLLADLVKEALEEVQRAPSATDSPAAARTMSFVADESVGGQEPSSG
jgi:hypothetical protein